MMADRMNCLDVFPSDSHPLPVAHDRITIYSSILSCSWQSTSLSPTLCVPYSSVNDDRTLRRLDDNHS